MEEKFQVQSLPQTSSNNNFVKRVTTGKSFLFIFTILAVAALGSGVLVYNASQVEESKNQGKTSQENKNFISDNVIIYGYWGEDKAVIATHNLKNNTSGVLTTLPTNVKHVKITSPTTLLYIAETDQRDHGKTIKERNLETGVDSVVFSADTDFGIDDYAVSPNARYISVWEVKMPESSAVLINGTSRVVNLDRSTNQRYTIYDEVFDTSNPVHYPIGITDTGELFTDRFLANSGAGWAYGMSHSNLTGTQELDISQMVNGTYSSQPTMSPDGRYIAFAGYSGTDGTVEVNGFRKALINPNTVELLSTEDLEKRVVREEKEGTQYPSVIWDKSSSTLLFTEDIVSETDFSFAQFQYNPEINTEKTIISPAESAKERNGIAYASLTDSSYLVAKRETKGEFMGNLGGKYGRAFKDLAALKKPGNSLTGITLTKSPVQIIDVESESFFSSIIQNVIFANSQKQLQLQTFVIKPKLAPKREIQQSNPIAEVPQPVGSPGNYIPPQPQECVDGQPYQTAKQCYGTACGDRLLQSCNGNKACEENAKENYIADDGSCTDSPLYLYGDEGQRVSVQIGVPLYFPNIPYSPERGVEAEISTNGSFYANGKKVEGFSFDYTPGIKKIQRPEYGTVATRSDLEKTLTDYALKLGLNTKETTDLLKETEQIKSDYQFVSFFDHNTSHNVLPLYFTPKPETYRSIVFYIEEFSKKPNLKLKNPNFDPIVREGLTAVEVSVFTR